MYFELLEIDYKIVRENGNRRRTESGVRERRSKMKIEEKSLLRVFLNNTIRRWSVSLESMKKKIGNITR